MLNKHDFHMINRFLLYGSNELFLNKKEKGFPYVQYNVQSIPILILSSPTNSNLNKYEKKNAYNDNIKQNFYAEIKLN